MKGQEEGRKSDILYHKGNVLKEKGNPKSRDGRSGEESNQTNSGILKGIIDSFRQEIKTG